MKKVLLILLLTILGYTTRESVIIEVLLNKKVVDDLILNTETYEWTKAYPSMRREMRRRQWMIVPKDSVYYYQEYLIKEE